MSESSTTVTFHTVGSSLNPAIVLNYDEGKIETSNVTVTELHANNISGKLYFNNSDNSVTFFNPLNIGYYHIKFNDTDSEYAIESTSVNVTNITTESINSQSIKFVNDDVVIKDKATLDLTVKAIYAIVVGSMAAGYGANALSSLEKADWFNSAVSSLKTLAKSDEAIANAFPAIKSLMT